MCKLFKMLCLGIIGGLYGWVLIITYIISLLCLLTIEIIGTKTFMTKFNKLNKFIVNEFKNTIKSYAEILERV